MTKITLVLTHIINIFLFYGFVTFVPHFVLYKTSLLRGIRDTTISLVGKDLNQDLRPVGLNPTHQSILAGGLTSDTSLPIVDFICYTIFIFIIIYIIGFRIYDVR